ncbi:MAG TPA: DUF4190 domain-containing protein [Anaerolineaceae bacterium]|nr:DUF4190 domain-containing protein [Anaerolineaceae bacterium]
MTLPPRLDLPVQPAAVPPSLNPKDSSLALASLITGILGWTILPLLGSVAAIVTGHLGKKEVRESHGALAGEGMATAGLILGYIQIGFFVLGLIAAIVLLLVLPKSTWGV